MDAKTIAQSLLQIKAIKLSPQKPFTWASGILSPIYCDNRIALSYPAVRRQINEGFVGLSASFSDFNVVAGVATAGIPHGAVLADALNKPFVYVRAKAKEHGRQNLIEGYLPKGSKVLVVEDLISTGGSSLQAIEALQAEGAEVVGTVAIFTYGFDKAAKAFAKANIPLQTLSNYDTLIAVAQEEGYISKEEIEVLQQWRAQQV